MRQRIENWSVVWNTRAGKPGHRRDGNRGETWGQKPGLAYYGHADNLGSSRLATTPGRTKYYDVAYAPYGENYDGSGTTADLFFTDENQDTVGNGWGTNLYDFMFREYRTGHGRWTSPDPAGLGAVDPSNPQSWNRYAYVNNNPVGWFDPLGLCGEAAQWSDAITGSGSNASEQTSVTVSIPCEDPCPPGTGWAVVSGFAICGWPGMLGELAQQVQGEIDAGRDRNSGNNGRQPNKITCRTVLPNGQTVGSYVNQLSNTINNAGQSTSTPYGSSASYAAGYSPLSVPGQVYSQMNFKINFRGQGNAAFLGDAGNFAFAAVSANIGVPLFAVEAVAGGYALWAGHQDANGPYFMDASATVQIPAGYGAGCKGY
jgi:RHS repeat-associated protein